MLCAKGVAWLSVRTVFPFDQTPVRDRNGASPHVTLVVFIALLNVTTMLSMNPTPVAPLTGLVDVMYGFGHDGWNVHRRGLIGKIKKFQ